MNYENNQDLMTVFRGRNERLAVKMMPTDKFEKPLDPVWEITNFEYLRDSIIENAWLLDFNKTYSFDDYVNTVYFNYYNIKNIPFVFNPESEIYYFERPYNNAKHMEYKQICHILDIDSSF